MGETSHANRRCLSRDRLEGERGVSRGACRTAS
jgi:hypothetical protein